MAGPNGAGKSTFVRYSLAPSRLGTVFVNADVIAAQRWPDDPAAHAYEASRAAAQLRSTLLATGESFITETVFSHPSKLDLIDEAQAAGYDVSLWVLMVPVDMSVARVAQRVEDGGHSVPEEKIRQRHDRLWRLVAQATLRAEVTTFLDNTADPRVVVASFAHGLARQVPRWPPWVHPDLPQTLGGRVEA